METILSAIEEKRDVLNATADFLWDHPETAFTEFESAKYLCDVLRKEGFTVEENIAGIATAFTGTFGSGKPVIGILGEYAAKVLAAGAVELMKNPELLARAKAEHAERVGEGYVPPIPMGVRPTAMDALRK